MVCVKRKKLCNCHSSFFFFFSYLSLSLDRLAKFYPMAALSTCDQDRNLKYDMSSAFNPCSLEITSNDKLKREHVGFSSLATKNIVSPLPLCSLVTYHEGFPLMKSYDPLTTWSCKVTWQTNFLITLLADCL